MRRPLRAMVAGAAGGEAGTAPRVVPQQSAPGHHRPHTHARSPEPAAMQALTARMGGMSLGAQVRHRIGGGHAGGPRAGARACGAPPIARPKGGQGHIAAHGGGAGAGGRLWATAAAGDAAAAAGAARRREPHCRHPRLP